MVCGPAASVEIWHVATPPLNVWPPAFEQVIVLMPSLKVTVPVGGPVTEVFEVTVAVKVTFWLTNDGFKDEVTAVVVPDWLTTWPPAKVPVLGSKLPSPA